MIYLFEDFDTSSHDLYQSLKAAGYVFTAIAFNDDGFLPEDVLSPYNIYTRDTTKQRLPLYFNRVALPPFYEVRGTASSGEIYDGAILRGRIFYASPKRKRYIKIIDHLSPNGQVIASDHYDAYGHRFAQTSFDAHNHRTVKTYYDVHGAEVIVENFMTGDIILNKQGKMYIYKNKIDFVKAMIHDLGLDHERIVYNSLSLPFFLSESMPTLDTKPDLLFWQEEIKETVPGNMQAIIQGRSNRTAHIIVQRRDAYQKLLAMGVSSELIDPLGFIYHFSETSPDYHKALIMTNSDQLESIETIIKGCPHIQFYIGAITEMSSKLLSLGAYDHVHLYPNIKEHNVKKLFETCGLYLDINYANEILNSLREAFIHHQVIYGFEETLHDHTYIEKSHIYKKDQVDELVHLLNQMDETTYQHELEKQESNAFTSTKENYQHILEDL